MLTAQDIFLVAFSILYGIMLNACIGLDLFHFGNLLSRDYPKVKKRLAISIGLINILPIIVGGILFTNIGEIEIEGYSFLNVRRFIGVFFLSL